jgi:hypothetical protein
MMAMATWNYGHWQSCGHTAVELVDPKIAEMRGAHGLIAY